jgi:hypothetical protein
MLNLGNCKRAAHRLGCNKQSGTCGDLEPVPPQNYQIFSFTTEELCTQACADAGMQVAESAHQPGNSMPCSLDFLGCNTIACDTGYC